jgi:hypothetical protein
MDDLTVFNYGGSNVRTIRREVAPWWVLKHRCIPPMIERGDMA